MDFTFTDEQQEVAALAARILGDRATPERVAQVEQTADRFDRELWAELAAAGLLGIALPESHGGAGLGVTELCLVLEQQGRRVAPLPLLWSSLAAMAVAAFAPPETASRWVPAAAAGDVLLTCALAEPGAGDPARPSVSAVAEPGGEWRISGQRVSVPYAHVADRVLTPASVAGRDTLVVLLVDPTEPGTSHERAEATDRQVLSHLALDGARGELVGGGDAVTWIQQRALVGLAALQLGVAEEALARAASYTSTRVQFGKPLSSFQSTSARAADAYIDTQAMAVTLWQAAWRIDQGLDAGVAVEVAKWWAAEAGQRVVHAAQHLHGGLGADVSYPVHRYFLAGKQLEDTLGGGSTHLARIGATLAGA